MRARVVIGVAVLLLAGCGPGSDPDAGVGARRAAEYRSARVEASIESASRVVRTRGFSADGDEQRGFLVEQGSEVRAIAMRTGSCWVVLGAGSSALRELELRIFDADGTEVARDGEQGTTAVVRFCPAQNGTYYASLRAAAGSGLFALRAFRGPTGLALREADVLRATGDAPEGARDPE